MNRLLFALLLLLLFPVANLTAQELPAPQLQEGKFVYTIPENFNPPLIGIEGMNQLNGEIKKLHFPFYVVLVQTLPGSGDGDQLAARAIDNIAHEWMTYSPTRYTENSQIFLLTYQPRKYRFLSGARFKNQLGFERNAHKPYTALFDRAVQGTPKDPKGGIIALMKAADEYLFDQTDPARILARAEKKRQEYAREQHDVAASRLDSEITRLEDLLRDSAYLPSNANHYSGILENARTIRQANKTQDMADVAQTMSLETDSLARFVEKKHSEANTRALGIAFKWIVILGLVISLIAFFFSRLKRLVELRNAFTEQANAWDEKMQNALKRYVSSYGERESVVSLIASDTPDQPLVGKTKELYVSVTTEIDAIYALVFAMGVHVNECKNLASKGNFLRLQPLRDALVKLESTFEFDTGELNPDQLFGSLTKHIEINPSRFIENVEKRFEITQKNWMKLKTAADARLISAESFFSHKKLDDMIVSTIANNIPHRWIASHPLFGDAASDTAFYQRVNNLRLSDPLEYCEEIERLKKKEESVFLDLHRIVSALDLVKKGRVTRPSPTNLVVDGGDDPCVTFDKALRQEDVLQGLLASASDIKQIETKAREIDDLHKACATQTAVLASATERAGKALSTADAAHTEVCTVFAAATNRVLESSKIHKDTKIFKFMREGEKSLKTGSSYYETAKKQFDTSQMLNASRTADTAKLAFTQARSQFERALSRCEELDQKKRLYEVAVIEAEQKRDQFQSKLRKFGDSRTTLRSFNPPVVTGATDYEALLVLYSQTEGSWQQQASQAQRNHEAAERRERQEREAEERRIRDERDAEERRQRSYNSYSSSSSNSSSSSSSSGSWGSDYGSSSSGGGWSSSDSGSSSSGGDW